MSVCLKTVTAYPGIWSVNDYKNDFNPSSWKKADPSDFGEWRKNHSDSTQGLITPCEGDARWGTLVYKYFKEVYYDKNKKKVESKDPEGTVAYGSFTHRNIICLDPKSPYAGNIYNGDSKIVMYGKFLAILLYVRPMHTVVYTLYNASLVHAAVIIFQGIANKKPANEILQKVVCSLVDIVRTPVYNVAIMIVALAGVVLAPFHPEFVYDIRALVGRLSRELGWGKGGLGLHDCNPCMQTWINIMEYTLNNQEIVEGRDYVNPTNPVLVGLENSHHKP